MVFSFPFLRANDLRTSLLIMRTHSLLYVGLFPNLIVNAVNNNDQHVWSGTNVRMSQNPHLRWKRMGTGIIIARRKTITLRPGQGRAARQLHMGSDADADADADADVDADINIKMKRWIQQRVFQFLERLVNYSEEEGKTSCHDNSQDITKIGSLSRSKGWYRKISRHESNERAHFELW